MVRVTDGDVPSTSPRDGEGYFCGEFTVIEVNAPRTKIRVWGGVASTYYPSAVLVLSSSIRPPTHAVNPSAKAPQVARMAGSLRWSS